MHINGLPPAEQAPLNPPRLHRNHQYGAPPLPALIRNPLLSLPLIPSLLLPLIPSLIYSFLPSLPSFLPSLLSSP